MPDALLPVQPRTKCLIYFDKGRLWAVGAGWHISTIESDR